MIKTMSVDELKRKMDAGETFTLIDCREQNEWDQGHIPGAKLIPLSRFNEHISELKNSDEIILQCRSGVRSLKACQILLENDFENLANLEGGILDWENKGHEIQR